MFFDLE